MRAKGILDKDEHRQLEMRLTAALATAEGVYSEARRSSDSPVRTLAGVEGQSSVSNCAA